MKEAGALPVEAEKGESEPQMAFSVKIFGLTLAGTNPLWELQAPWWDAWELMGDQRFRDVSMSPGYMDYEAFLIVPEAKELAKKYAPKAMEWMTERVEELDRNLDVTNILHTRVRVLIAEWESGLGP